MTNTVDNKQLLDRLASDAAERKNGRLRYLLRRLAIHQDTAIELDYLRIEELCHLILHEMFGEVVPELGTMCQSNGGKVYALREGAQGWTEL